MSILVHSMVRPDAVKLPWAKAHLSELLKEVAKGKAYEVVGDSGPAANIFDVEQYKALLEQIEDLEDGLAFLQGKLESKGEATLDWEDVKAEYWTSHPEADSQG